MKKPEFLIIGAQKCGTARHGVMLKLHSGTYLPGIKGKLEEVPGRSLDCRDYGRKR